MSATDPPLEIVATSDPPPRVAWICRLILAAGVGATLAVVAAAVTLASSPPSTQPTSAPAARLKIASATFSTAAPTADAGAGSHLLARGGLLQR